MLRLYILINFVCCCFADVSHRIVNGVDAQEGEFPYVVSLRNKDYRHFCGGTILDERHVLTAAHCLCYDIRPEPPYSIQYGSVNITSDDTRSVNVSKYFCNSAYTSADNVFDVAVLQLETPIPKGKGNWSSVQLAKVFSPSLLARGTIIGWGMIWDGGPISQVLQKLTVNILHDFACGLRFDTMHQICVSSLLSGACKGDSGSPLLVNGIQVGIASFVTTNCEGTSALFPNVYARVPTYFEWIQAMLK